MKKVTKSMKDLHYYPTVVANMLEKLWIVAPNFTLPEYEKYVSATYFYLSKEPGTGLTNGEFNAFSQLVQIVEKYNFLLKEYNINTEFCA